MSPDFSHELALQAQGFARIAGVDEVGRGPLAGPVMACAVVLDPAHIPEGLNDSKALTAKRREALTAEILRTAEVSIAEASVAEIDTLNILRASHLAMVRALQGLSGYGWEKNAGYPSPAHKQALLDLGVTPHHRRSFKPIHNILYQAKTISD
jgi:ribonuclease HII